MVSQLGKPTETWKRSVKQTRKSEHCILSTISSRIRTQTKTLKNLSPKPKITSKTLSTTREHGRRTRLFKLPFFWTQGAVGRLNHALQLVLRLGRWRLAVDTRSRPLRSWIDLYFLRWKTYQNPRDNEIRCFVMFFLVGVSR